MLRQQIAPRAPRGTNIRRLFVLTGIVGAAASIQPASANAVLDWNNEFLTIAQQTSINWVNGPPEVARDIAIMGNAMSDAVNAATGGTLSSYAYTGPTVAGTDPGIAAAAAAYTALKSIYTDAAWQTPITTQTGLSSVIPATTLANRVVLPELDSFLATSLGFNPASCGASSSSSQCVSYNLGVAASNAVTAKQSTDGAVAAIQQGLTRNGVLSSYPAGTYQPPSGRPEMLPTWSGVTPTGISQTQLAAATATVSGPPIINSPAYATALLQVECQGSGTVLPADIQASCTRAGFTRTSATVATQQAKSALFWNDPGMTTQPPGHWLQIADTALQSKGSSLLQSAQLTALLGDAENDAGIADWKLKYQYNLWRPVTALNASCTVSHNGSGKVIARASAWSQAFTTCDPGWSSLIGTPPHPDYAAGHPAFSGAGATILADFFGTDAMSFTSSSDYYCNAGTLSFNSDGSLKSCTQGGRTYTVGNAGDCAVLTAGLISNNSPLICPITETFSSFSQASSGQNGAEFSRVAGGIHTPFAVEDALTVGNAVGAMVAANAGLPNVVPEPSALLICAAGLLPLGRLNRRRSGVA